MDENATYLEWRETHPPMAGGAAPNPGPAQGAAAAGGQGGGQPSQPPADDPYELSTVINERVPEHLRPYLEPVLGDLRAHLDERVNPLREVHDRFSPLQERLTPLLEAADPDSPDAGSVLDGLLDFYELTGDPNRIDDFMSWWDRVGEDYGFFDDDGEPAGGQGDPDLAALEGGNGDPRDQEIAELRQQVQELNGRLDSTDRESAVSAHETRLSNQLDQLMASNGIEDDQSAPEEERASTVILRLAQTHEGEDAIARGVQDFMRLTGRAQGQLMQQAGEQTVGVDQLTQGLPPLVGSGVGAGGGGSQPGASLADGRAPTDPEPVRSWEDARRIAIERLSHPGV